MPFDGKEIKLRIILISEFPDEAPIIEIAPGQKLKKVDYISGVKVTVPYLTNWSRVKHPASNLVINSVINRLKQ